MANVLKPATRPATKPATRPALVPATKPATRPALVPATKPATRPALVPATKGKPRGRAGGRKALPEGEARVHVGGRVAPATAAAIEKTGRGTGATLDAWWEELQRLREANNLAGAEIVRLGKLARR